MRFANNFGLFIGLAVTLSALPGAAAVDLPVYSPVSPTVKVAENTAGTEVQTAQADPGPAQSSAVTLADVARACNVQYDASPVRQVPVCDTSAGAVGAAIEQNCRTHRGTGRFTCKTAGPYADILSAFAAKCRKPLDPDAKDRAGRPMKAYALAIECGGPNAQ